MWYNKYTAKKSVFLIFSTIISFPETFILEYDVLFKSLKFYSQFFGFKLE